MFSDPFILFHTSFRERREDGVFRALLKLCYGLEERLLNASAEEVELIADLVGGVLGFIAMY
jgi:hypothetical protein